MSPRRSPPPWPAGTPPAAWPPAPSSPVPTGGQRRPGRFRSHLRPTPTFRGRQLPGPQRPFGLRLLGQPLRRLEHDRAAVTDVPASAAICSAADRYPLRFHSPAVVDPRRQQHLRRRRQPLHPSRSPPHRRRLAQRDRVGIELGDQLADRELDLAQMPGMRRPRAHDEPTKRVRHSTARKTPKISEEFDSCRGDDRHRTDRRRMAAVSRGLPCRRSRSARTKEYGHADLQGALHRWRVGRAGGPKAIEVVSPHTEEVIGTGSRRLPGRHRPGRRRGPAGLRRGPVAAHDARRSGPRRSSASRERSSRVRRTSPTSSRSQNGSPK